jgi:hypothetical protein
MGIAGGDEQVDLKGLVSSPVRPYCIHSDAIRSLKSTDIRIGVIILL